MSIFKQKINIYVDSLKDAIGKKAKNHNLSNLSLTKLIEVTKRQYNFNNSEANFIFGDNVKPHHVNDSGVATLIEHLKELKGMKGDLFIREQIKTWEDKATKLLIKHENIADNKKLIGKGSRGQVYLQGGVVTKQMRNFKVVEANHEVKMCNEWNKQSGGLCFDAVVISPSIKMPFVEGTTPDFIETCKGVRNMYDKGFLIGDAKPCNFVKTPQGNISPIDFGLVFTLKELEIIDDEIKKQIIFDYIKGGYRYIPNDLKEKYFSCIKNLDDSLGKNTPTKNIKLTDLIKAGFTM